MAYSKVSLICGLLTFLVISNGVSARWLDDLVAKIKEDIKEQNHPMVESQKPSVEMVNSHAPAPAPAPEMSAYQLSAVGKSYDFGDSMPMGSGGAESAHDEDEDDSSINSDSSFQPNDTDDDNNETDNAGDGPLP